MATRQPTRPPSHFHQSNTRLSLVITPYIIQYVTAPSCAPACNFVLLIITELVSKKILYLIESTPTFLTSCFLIISEKLVLPSLCHCKNLNLIQVSPQRVPYLV